MFYYFSFSGSPSFTEGWCPGSKAPIFNELNSHATAPIIYLHNRSFSISCWIKQTKWSSDEVAAIYGDWTYPWQFLLSTNKINWSFHFSRPGFIKNQVVWFSSASSNASVALNTWLHVVVIWNQLKEIVLIYVDGKMLGSGKFPPGIKFLKSTGNLYKIGNDGHGKFDHQFYGSIMDLYVFGTALSLDQIKKLRGLCKLAFI